MERERETENIMKAEQIQTTVSCNLPLTEPCQNTSETCLHPKWHSWWQFLNLTAPLQPAAEEQKRQTLSRQSHSKHMLLCTEKCTGQEHGFRRVLPIPSSGLARVWNKTPKATFCHTFMLHRKVAHRSTHDIQQQNQLGQAIIYVTKCH